MRAITKQAAVQYRVGGDAARCGTCLRACVLRPGQTGLCGNYKNINGVLYNIGYGIVSAIESRPIEIKPLFHFHPGSTATTFSGYGCNFLCPWCQNWAISKVKPDISAPRLNPHRIIEYALRAGDDSVCASFNEPTIHLEYLLDVFKEAKERGLYTTMVSNGSMTIEALLKLVEAGVDAMNIDIKGCPETYRRFIGVPEPTQILETARKAIELGVHVEAVYLVVTGANDWNDCIDWVINSHLKYLGEDTPLHINRYYPAHKYWKPPTKTEILEEIYRKALREGINYVYIGNVPTTKYMITRCPNRGEPLIIRDHYSTKECRMRPGNRCPRCGYRLSLIGECRPTRGRQLNKQE